MALPKEIRVRAAPGVFALVPGYAAAHGMQVEYVGRRTDHEALKAHGRVREDGAIVIDDLEACYPADPDHNATFLRGMGPQVLASVRRLLADGDALPGDEATARWANVKIPAAAPAPAPAPSASPAAPRVPRRPTSDEKA